MYGTLASAFDLSLGYLGILNFGFAGFFGAGAYAAGLASTKLGLSPWVSWLLGGAFSCLLGLVTGLLALRFKSKLVFAMFTWFFGLTIQQICYVWIDLTGGMRGLLTPPLPSVKLPFFEINFADRAIRTPYYYTMLMIAISTLVLLYMIVKSRIGITFKAIRDDEIAAEMLGIDTYRAKVLNFTISCFVAGIIGGFYCFYIGVLSPDTVLSTDLTVQILTMSYIGGRGTLWGPLLGSFIVILLLEAFRPLIIYRLIFYGCLLILTMIFFPKGISGIKKYIWKSQ